FLLDKTGRLVLIDFELTWSIQTNYPLPPFGVGTPGFMSPEQIRGDTPTEKEDIYAIGSFMLSFFSNLLANKWNASSRVTLTNKLTDMIGDETLSRLITGCVDPLPKQRPTLDSVSELLSDFRNKLVVNCAVSPQAKIIEVEDNCDLQHMIEMAVNGLANPTILNSKGCWLSKLTNTANEIVTEQVGMKIIPGWYKGLAGPLWVLTIAQKVQININSCLDIYNRNLELVREIALNQDEPSFGLFQGSAGRALAIAERLSSNVIADVFFDEGHLLSSLSSWSKDLSLAEGISGQGLALLSLEKCCKSPKIHNLLQVYTTNILREQEKAGYWKTTPPGALFDFHHGNIGIIWFLLAYLNRYADAPVKLAVQKAIEWLIEKTLTKTGTIKKSIANSNTNKIGIVLCLIHSYQVLKEDKFKRLAEINLHAITERMVSSDFTLQTG